MTSAKQDRSILKREIDAVGWTLTVQAPFQLHSCVGYKCKITAIHDQL